MADKSLEKKIDEQKQWNEFAKDVHYPFPAGFPDQNPFLTWFLSLKEKKDVK